MGLSDLDGFLTGIAVGPELILPSEWLPVIWGGDQPVLTRQRCMPSSARSWAVTMRSSPGINADPEALEPIFWEGPQGEVVASDWANGFLDAVALRPEAWEPLTTHRRAGIMMMPVLLLNGDATFDAGPDSPVDRDAFLAEVPDIVPACVAGIHEFWRNYQSLRRSRGRSKSRGHSAVTRRPVSIDGMRGIRSARPTEAMVDAAPMRRSGPMRFGRSTAGPTSRRRCAR